MKLEKAIEIGKELPDNLNNVLDYEQQGALKLLIEAGKFVNRHSFKQRAWEGNLLPGETED